MSLKNIHILGVGNLSKLIAHALREFHPRTPLTLLFHRASLVDDWERAGQRIEIVRNGQPNLQGNFNYEIVDEPVGEIENLIVGTKTYATVNALKPLRDRLSSRSNLLFLQNGIGMSSFSNNIEEPTEDCFYKGPLMR
jgi:2-dehydropantoate 2-reductase